MEIERKFLLKEGNRTFPSQFNIEELKKDIKKYGRNVTQHYLPLELIETVSEEYDFKIKFKPDQFRIRKLGKKCSLAIKSDGEVKRSEFEKTISKEVFDTLAEYKEKTVKKIRLMKKIKEKPWFIDYYPKHSLIIAEIEFDDEKEADNFRTEMKDVSGVDEYKNKYLAE